MAEIKTKQDLRNATDEEITSFFQNARCMGYFDTDIPKENRDNFCGKLTNITINGEDSNLCPSFLYVPNSVSAFAKIGLCEFKCSLNLNKFRGELHQYRLTVYKIMSVKIKDVKSVGGKTVAEEMDNLRLQDKFFIGQFFRNKNGSYTIKDIRRSNFSKLTLQNKRQLPPLLFDPKGLTFEDGAYYKFSWILKEIRDNFTYLFAVDISKPFEKLTPRGLVDILNKNNNKADADSAQKIDSMLDTLRNQLTASGKEIFIYELLQNANDYPVEDSNGNKEKVDVEFHITNESLLFMHSGAEFNERNVAAICNINDKEKSDNKDTIGYKGIGFKTVFLSNNYVYLQTGKYSFSFDEVKTRRKVNPMWQITPFWTEFKELTPAERYVFTTADDKFRVKFSLRPKSKETLRGPGQSYRKMFQEVFKNERVILFIPNLSSVKIYLEPYAEPIECRTDNEHWQVNHFQEPVDERITETINEDIDNQEKTGALKIPTKYYDFTKTKVSFACAVEGSELKEVSNSLLYCYLPTQATWGFKFLMNTDMIPNGARDDVEIEFTDHKINFNAEISEIAGQKFFEWIKFLCDLKKYKYTSIFSLIPDFTTNVKEHGKYKELIERFKAGFDSKIRTNELIPVGPDKYAKVADIILDETGLTASGIMTDEDFIRITGKNYSLPLKMLRDDNDFTAFLKRYLKELNCKDNIWGFEDLKELCSKPEFQEWLSVQDNNDRFLDFLLTKGKLTEFAQKEIFIKEGAKELRYGKNLYYDVDAYRDDLKNFNEYLPCLSLATRRHFKDNEKWDKAIANQFCIIDCTYVVDNGMMSKENISNTIEKLKDKDTSIHFFKFLAENVAFKEQYLSLPFINDKGQASNGFNAYDKVFFDSVAQEGHAVCDAKWMTGIKTEFISSDYLPVTQKYFTDNFGVVTFSHEFVATYFILHNLIKDYHNTIATAIGEDLETSKAFIAYCYKNKSLYGDNSLWDYALHVNNINAEESWQLGNSSHIYFASKTYDSLSIKTWLSNDWMYELDPKYLEGQGSSTELKNFIGASFGIHDITEQSFFTEVVKAHLGGIFVNTNATNDADGKKNIDFVKYLDANFQLIEKESSSLFEGLFVRTNDNACVAANSNNLYCYDSELLSITQKSWFPKDVVTICKADYGDSKTLKKIGVKIYEFSTFYDDVIVENLVTINANIKDKGTSIAFHNFIIGNKSQLSVDQQKKMQGAKVYLYDQKIPAEKSSGHNILSEKANELFASGLVGASNLDIIDPDYQTGNNTDYWETNLNNTKFTAPHFFTWLKNNITVFNTTIQNKEKNLKFWRWAMENKANKQLATVGGLNVLLKNSKMGTTSDLIYMADDYLQETKIEKLITNYNSNALFISSEYIKEGDDLNAWKEFWISAGIKYEMVDILVKTVMPILGTMDDEGLPTLIADNRDSLDDYYKGQNTTLIAKLKSLKVKTSDHTFRTILETTYITCEDREPFSFIKLPNIIKIDGNTKVGRLLRDILADGKIAPISTLQQWRQKKIDHYLFMQSTDIESIRSIHYQFINELAALKGQANSGYGDLNNIEKILILNREGQFCAGNMLTSGSAYQPYFDFEKCGINSLAYVSDSYVEKCSEKINRLFTDLHVHYNFRKEDVCLLSNRECALYFWQVYLPGNNSTTIKRLIVDENLLNNLACIPTKNKVCKPSELYYGEEVEKFIYNIEEPEDKFPLKSLPDIILSDGTIIFKKLPFKSTLDFLDALYATTANLNIGNDRRCTLLEWMIASYKTEYDAIIKDYRDAVTTCWRNNNNNDVQIKQLYALEHGNTTLDALFGSNPRIINKKQLPATQDKFNTACQILGITIINGNDTDLKTEAQSSVLYTERNNELRLFALVIAGVSDEQKWQEQYKQYCEKLEKLKLYKCESILIKYDKDKEISTTLDNFYYPKDSTEFYFVNSLDDKLVYQDYVSAFRTYLGAFKLKEDVIRLKIMDNSKRAYQYVKERNELMLDEAFKEELVRLYPPAAGELRGNKVEEEETGGIVRQKFTTIDIGNEDSQTGEAEQEVEITSTAVQDSSAESVTTGSLEHRDTSHPSASSHLDMEPDDPRHIEEAKPASEEKPSFADERQQQASPTKPASDSNAQPSEEPEEKFENLPEHVEAEDTRDDSIGVVDLQVDGSSPMPIPRRPMSSGTTRRPFSPGKSRGGFSEPEFDEESAQEFIEKHQNKGTIRTLDSRDPDEGEIAEINDLFDNALTPEEIVTQHYLIRLRLYHKLINEQYMTNGTKDNKRDFITDKKRRYLLPSGKYIYPCSALGGIMYISPQIWNLVEDGNTIVYAYVDNKSDDFMKFESTEDILKWIDEDSIIIKLIGKEKVDVIRELYSGALEGVAGTAYTLIRVRNGRYDALFNPINLPKEENEEDYE